MAYVLGVYVGGHDVGACLLRDGEIVVAIEEERLTRVKHAVPADQRSHWFWYNFRWGYFPWASVTYCLETAGISLDQLDAIVVPQNDWFSVDWGGFLPIDRKKIIVADQPAGGTHHFCHALSAFHASPFEKAAVLVVDADGSAIVTADGSSASEAETGYFFENRKGNYKEIFKNRYTAEMLGSSPSDKTAADRWGGIGLMYEFVTVALGFKNRTIEIGDPGKTMGLAPYGRPNAELAESWVGRDGFHLDFSKFYEFARRSGVYEFFFTNEEQLGLLARDGQGQFARDLAYKVQIETEQAMVHLAEQLKRATGAANLCLAGGVALNSVTNGIIHSKKIFDRVFVQPCAADNGQAIGLAYYGHLQLSGGPIKPIRHAFGGRTYPAEGIHRLLEDCGIRYRKLPDDQALAEDAAEQLADSRILGWVQGGSELGPRALGHRSILADSRPLRMKDVVNAQVKFREGFRPFAPSVTAERANEVFELEGESPYMLIVAPVRKAWADRVLAVTHVDGSARIQTVDREVDPLYHRLISAFGERTGVPVVLNTSFNLRGMPIVESPKEALQCFLYTAMDVLYLGPYRVEQPTAAELFPALSPRWEFNASRSLSGGKPLLQLRFAPMNRKVKPRTLSIPMIEGVDMEALCSKIDGKHSIALALGATGPEDAARTRAGLNFVKKLLRDGALRLRFEPLGWL